MGRRKTLFASALMLVVVALWSAPTAAECPNGCSGNGACMAKDMCNCYKNYQGNDCLDRTCQFGYAHADTPKGDINMDQLRNTPSWILTNSQQDPAGTYEYFNPDAATNEAHFYMECSNKGLCDRSLGSCTCFDGYEGVACQRAACPNKCTGHGTCESLRELGLKTTGTLFGIPDNVAAVTYDLWDSRVTYGCRCDPWYHGADCSLRSCKVGVDPMFLAVGSATYETFALHVWLDATAYPVATARPANANDYVRIRLFDYHGEAYITDAIPIVSDTTSTIATANAAAVAAAIKKIPNQTFRNIICEPTNAFVGTELEGYLSKRTASTHGLSVVCQFTNNPGRLRAPEIVAYNFDLVVDSTKKSAQVITMEDGLDSEWFTKDSGLVVSKKTTGSDVELVLTTTTSVVSTTPRLFKLGPYVGVGTITATDKITLTYPIVHTLANYAVLEPADSSGFAITKLTVSTGGVAVGATTISIATTDPAMAAGDLLFIENQFYNYVSVAGTATPWVITLDRPFRGNSVDNGANSILVAYKVTPPKPEFQYKYVSQCSGRGLCNTETGVCGCFKGYTNDNCDTQNILAL